MTQHQVRIDRFLATCVAKRRFIDLHPVILRDGSEETERLWIEAQRLDDDETAAWSAIRSDPLGELPTNLTFATALEARTQIQQLTRLVDDLRERLTYVLDRLTTETGSYTFPDGETWDAGRLTAGSPLNTPYDPPAWISPIGDKAP